MRDAPLPDLVLYGRPGCGLCDEARGLLIALLDERAHAGLLSPRPRRTRHRDRPGLGARLLRLDPGRRARRPAPRARDERGQAAPPPDRRPGRLTEPMSGTDLTILVALAAGVISFLSPCVLPLVPAYLGQLTAIAVAGSADGARPSRWLAMRHALAYVAGFGAVFTLLGITATFAAGPLADYLPALRVIGGLHPDRPRPRPGRAAPHPVARSGPGVRSMPARRGRWRRRPARPPSAAGGGQPGPRRSARRPGRQLGRRLAGVVRPRGDLRGRLDARASASSSAGS